MNIGINAGHTMSGQPGCGAVGYLNESNETRAVSKRLIDLLCRAGHTVYNCTNDIASSTRSNLQNICILANSQNLDLFVSIHFNAGGGNGCECYTYGAQDYDEAIRINKNLNKLGFKNRGIKDGRSLFVIKNTKAKAILVEVCFVDSQSDAKLYQEIGPAKIAEAICEAIIGEVPEIEPIKKLETSNDIIWELMNGEHKIEIQDIDKAINFLEKAKKEDSSLYWILYKLVNRGR